MIFSARYDDKEAPVRDANPPFSRCIVLPLPAEDDGTVAQELLSMAGEFLDKELTTPLGRIADQCRQSARVPGLAAELPVQTFGMYRIPGRGDPCSCTRPDACACGSSTAG